MFIIEIIALQWGTAKLAKIGRKYGKFLFILHGIGVHSSHGPGGEHKIELPTSDASSDIESKGKEEGKEAAFIFDEGVLAQMIGVGILEFGVILHRCGKFI